ncbi:MAG: molybdopterin-dependent oxidoreductase [Planctomycetota bacterium]
MNNAIDRREFIKVGIASLATLGIGELIFLTPGCVHAEDEDDKPKKAPRKINDYRKATKVTGVCLNCSTTCGIVGYVIDGKLVKVAGNPEDPNNGKNLCAKGQSGQTIGSYPERLLYPLRRVGARGEGLWKRVTWEEAYTEMVSRIQPCLQDGHPEQVALHIGRSRIGDIIGRFMDAIGSPVQLNHRALCSLNKRAANYATIGDADWESVDAERTKYLLNFGSNFYEAHQGHIHFLKRVVRGRCDNGAKLVTFDVRLSNTAGRSDEWFAPFSGTEGAVALAMGHIILKNNQIDQAFLEKWTNTSLEQLREFYHSYTPEWASKISGMPAKDIERIALEFAACRPHCAAFTNRGSHAHYNGFNNDRAVIMLNALVGSIGKVGGYVYGKGDVDREKFLEPDPVPPKPKIRTDLEDPPEYPLANFWQKMRVGQIVYSYIKEKRAQLKVYISYTIAAPLTWPEGRSLAVEVLKDESLIPFHACSDIVYSEMAHYSDLILPDATYMERWGLDARNSYEFQPYTTLRQPITSPPAECMSFADTLIQLGKRLGPNVAQYFNFKDHEDYVRLQCRNVPKKDDLDCFDYLKKHGVLVETSAPKYYEYYDQALAPAKLEGSRTDEKTGIIFKNNPKINKEEAIGIMKDGKAVRGFKTPSRHFEIFSSTVRDSAAKIGISDTGFPHYLPIPAHENLPEDRFILTTFKWNVHTQGRTASQKFLSEIVHDNPVWINSSTAKKLGVKTGDTVEITTFRPKGLTHQATGEVIGSTQIRAFVTEGIHPRVIAISNSLGNTFSGRAASAQKKPRLKGPGFDETVLPEDVDLSENLWWDANSGGKGAGFNVNAILPIQPSPITGMQSWFDTVCQIKKV